MSKTKLLWGIILVLILLQATTLAYFLSESKKTIPATNPSLLPAQETVEGEPNEATIVAQFQDSTITLDELVTRLMENYGEQVLDQMIDRRIVFSEAEKLGIQISEEEMNREMASLRLGYHSEDDFFQEMEAHGISSEELREEIEYYLLLEEMATLDIGITPEQIEAFYTENMELFEIPSQYRVYQIVVDTEEEARQVIQEISQGSSFEAVAAERSTDMVSSSNGGDMGIILSDDYFLSEDFKQAAETIELNTLSDPIPVPEGYAVIKVTERIEGEKQDLATVEGKIRRQLALQQIDGVAGFLERLREAANIEKLIFQD